MFKGLVKFPLRVARGVARRFTGGREEPEAEVRLPVRTDPEGPSRKPAAAPPVSQAASAGAVAPQPVTQPGTAGGPAQANPEAPQPATGRGAVEDGEAKGKAKAKGKADAAGGKAAKADAAKGKGAKADAKGKAKGKGAKEAAGEPVAVSGEMTPNPNAMKFVCSTKVVPKGSLSLNNQAVAAGHPLGEALFAIPGVRSVFAVNDFVTVTKDETTGWTELQPRVERAIADVLGQA